MKKHAIITSCNRKHAGFLVQHWLKSLLENVNLKNTDVIVLDYGLNADQVKTLSGTGVLTVKHPAMGQVVNRRFWDAAEFLSRRNYDQILLTDGADIIFQSDISGLFDRSKKSFRAVALELEVLFHEVFIPGNFKKDDGRKIYKLIKDKPVINAGFILGPKEKIISLGKEIYKLLLTSDRYGPDQVAVNYILHQSELILLSSKYNFMINNVKDGFLIKNGVFYDINGGLIPVVHNAGHNNILRPVRNFGYGEAYNTTNTPVYQIKRFYYRRLKYAKPLASFLLEKYLRST